MRLNERAKREVADFTGVTAEASLAGWPAPEFVLRLSRFGKIQVIHRGAAPYRHAEAYTSPGVESTLRRTPP
jgi:hypothetical protein